MFELGEFIGEGFFSAFFKIREHPELGVKILKRDTGRQAKRELERELRKAKILMKLDLPVPKYVEVIEVKVPEYFDKTLERGYNRIKCEEGRFRTNIWTDKLMNLGITYGLLMEYIEADLSIVSERRIDYIYLKEKTKIEKYGIEIDDSHSSHNVLWSKSKAKMYFIDFQFWDLSGMHNPIIKVRAWWEKIFR